MFCRIHEECEKGYILCCEICPEKGKCESECKNNSDDCKLCTGKYDNDTGKDS